MIYFLFVFQAGVTGDEEAASTRGGDGGERGPAEGEGEAREGAPLDKQVRLFIEMSTPFFKVRADGPLVSVTLNATSSVNVLIR